MLEPGIPAYRLTNRCPEGRYEIIKEICCDPGRDTVLQRIRLTASAEGPLRLYALLAPHLVNGGADNSGWVGDYKGTRMIFAEGDGTGLALACSRPFLLRSVGFVGVSDGWQQLSRDGFIAEPYLRADGGNIALTGELDLSPGGPDLVVAIAFGRTWSEAALRARASLQTPFDELREGYAEAWRRWQSGLRPLGNGLQAERCSYRTSTMVLRCHESPTFPGGLIASLSIPWGTGVGDDNLGGYHLVWPRDLVQTAAGFLAAGATEEARRVADHLRAIQEDDGHWGQNAWLDGTPYWNGLQIDETGLPILLLDLLLRHGVIEAGDRSLYWSVIDRAASYILANGPATGQDRWEENSGYTPYSLAVEIAALLAAADWAAAMGREDFARDLRETADLWNRSVEEWTYARDTELCREVGVDGYYVRIAPAEGEGPPVTRPVLVKNHLGQDASQPAWAIVSPDALALVRFGLRAADDPRILNTINVIDHLLKVEFPLGPCWKRYNGDGYGEHADGSGYDGSGIGRAWPLLTGERGHYELAAGRADRAASLLGTMEKLTSPGGLLPEQVWDAADIPEHELYRGKPSGSAMPLVWAHSEHIKLRRSLADGRVFDLPPQTVARYLSGKF
jgi:glucoamylase